MPARIIFVTANDTGAGKTVLTSLLARRLLDQGRHVRALKPVCSGGRSDARRLSLALRHTVDIDALNPWYFAAPIAPVLAARKEGKRLRLKSLAAFIRGAAASCELLLVEGAGGLLSPLGENCSSLDLIEHLRARPVVVCPNRLGAVNQIALVLRALPLRLRSRAVVVLMAPRKADAATSSNAPLIREVTGNKPVEFPRVLKPADLTGALQESKIRRAVDTVLRRLA
jgi:dethiobiotin synthetase